jgi:glycerol-3-phosphate cytidylyltransferase
MNILTVGTFEIPHIGHIKLFQRIGRLGTLYVGVNSDEYVEEYKGKKPMFTYQERCKLLNLCPEIDVFIKNTQDDLKPMIKKYNIHVLVIGSDWVDRYYKQAQIDLAWLDRNNVTFLYSPYTPIISTSEIKKRVKQTS